MMPACGLQCLQGGRCTAAAALQPSTAAFTSCCAYLLVLVPSLLQSSSVFEAEHSNGSAHAAVVSAVTVRAPHILLSLLVKLLLLLMLMLMPLLAGRCGEAARQRQRPHGGLEQPPHVLHNSSGETAQPAQRALQ
jgi:hypothetical protein